MKRAFSLFGFLVLFLAFASVIQVYGAETVNVTGEIIDTYCYGLMGAKGPSHRQCAIDCVKKGIPAGLLEDGTDKVYVLLGADYGARMVYDYNAGGNACSQPIEFTK